MIRYPKGVLNPEHINPNGLGYSFSKVEYERIRACTVPELGYGYHRVHRSADEGDMVRIFIIDGALEIHYKNET